MSVEDRARNRIKNFIQSGYRELYGDALIISDLLSELSAVREREQRYREAIESVEALIDESSGVYGLHLNGDPAPWSELRTGGRFEGWLYKFDDALKEE